MTHHVLTLAGETLHAMPSGALFWRAQRTLLVADLHLEKFSSYAKKGQMLPAGSRSTPTWCAQQMSCTRTLGSAMARGAACPQRCDKSS